jgi:citrate synthase
MDSGLQGVIAAETVLSHSDGERGIIWVRGHTLAKLVAEHGYEGSVALLWDGFAGNGLTREGIRAELGAARGSAFAGLDVWLDAATRRPLIEAMRLALAFLPEESRPADILAFLPVVISAFVRVAQGRAPLAPRPDLTTAADLLRMIHGEPASEPMVAALDAYWTSVIDNGLNASAYTARIIASTRASLVSAALGAYCAFTGSLHGGAPGPTLDMPTRSRRAATLTLGRTQTGCRRAGDGLWSPHLSPWRPARRRAAQGFGAAQPECRPARPCGGGRAPR